MIFIPIEKDVVKDYFTMSGVKYDQYFPYARWEGFDDYACLIVDGNSMDLAVRTQKGNTRIVWSYGCQSTVRMMRGGNTVPSFIDSGLHDKVASPKGLIEVGWQGLDKWLCRKHDYRVNRVIGQLCLMAFSAETRDECDMVDEALASLEISVSSRPTFVNGRVRIWWRALDEEDVFESYVDDLIQTIWMKSR